MRRFSILHGVLLLAPALGLTQQLDSNSITVSATRSSTLQPDQAVFAVAVLSPLTTGFSDVLAAVQSLGLSAANLSTVRTIDQVLATTPAPQAPPAIEWDFILPAPLAKLKDTLTTLTNVQKSIGQNNSGVILSLSFGVQNTQVSLQLQQSQTCPVPDLLADARAQAQKLADAAALNLGAVLAMSSNVSSNVGVALLGLYTSPAVCVLTVKFAATRY